MKEINAFPAQYGRVTERVKAIRLPHALSKAEEDSAVPPELITSDEYRVADFLVNLKDGKTYSFLACTPDFIKETMEVADTKSFLSPGLILLSEINIECILDAVEHWLALAENNYMPLEHFGVLQRNIKFKRGLKDASKWVDPLEAILKKPPD